MKLNRKIDKAPPAPTGDARQDIEAITDHMAYMQEQVNYILSLIYKAVEG